MIVLVRGYNLIYYNQITDLETLLWLFCGKDTRKGKSICRKTSQGTNAIFLAIDGKILSYISGTEAKRSGQIKETCRYDTVLDPSKRFPSLKPCF